MPVRSVVGAGLMAITEATRARIDRRVKELEKLLMSLPTVTLPK